MVVEESVPWSHLRARALVAFHHECLTLNGHFEKNLV